ncbi:MAG: DUF6580 family putative transport protein [Bacteroidota bacterium]
MKNIQLKDISIISGIILLGALSRLIPHPMNFTPIAAMALFGAAVLNDKRLAILIPFAAMFISDILLQLVNGTGFHNQMILVYGCTIFSSLIGFQIREQLQFKNIFLGTLAGAILFFITTNFGVWILGYYGYTMTGLVNCFAMAIPFFRGTITGDLFYSLFFFGCYSLVKSRVPVYIKK